MSYAVELYFDKAAENTVRSVWKALADAGVSTSMLDGISRPHITLGVCDELGASFKDELALFSRGIKPLTFNLSFIGSFNTIGGVMFFGPTPTDALFRLHVDFHVFFKKHACRRWKHYLPEQWVPHCTLAFSLSSEQLQRAFSIAVDAPLPITGSCAEIGLLSGVGVAEKELVSYKMGAQ